MKRLSILLVTFFSLFVSAAVFAWTIGPMNYQGRLLDAAGIPVTGNYNFIVRIYDDPTAGVLKFSEQHNSVAVDDGVYSFLVSTGTNSTGAWDVALWNTAQLFMEVEVNGGILLPRHRLSATPYAYQANLALTTNNALALGGKTAAQYDTILADICTSSKGKWLELAGKCLGVGASFPGPALANWSTLTASSNFSNLDLSRADISGIDFSGADLTATVFTKTTYSAQGMSGANLYSTVWNSAVSTDVSTATLSATTNLQNATFSNMDMSKWGLTNVTQANMNFLSAAELSACPPTLPASWVCVSDGNPGSEKVLLGPGVNLAAGSAASIYKNGSSYLNLGSAVLTAGLNLVGATFSGNNITQNFDNATLNSTNFSYTIITASSFAGANLTAASFTGAKLARPVFSPTTTLAGTMFVSADISYARFEPSVSNLDFSRATLRSVLFNNVAGVVFRDSVLDNVIIKGTLSGSPILFQSTRFTSLFKIANFNDADVPTATFSNNIFTNATLSGDFIGVTFTGTPTFEETTFSHINLCGATIPVTGASGAHPELVNTYWGYVRCPNNVSLFSNASPIPGTGVAGTCNTTTSTAIKNVLTPFSGCASAIP